MGIGVTILFHRHLLLNVLPGLPHLLSLGTLQLPHWNVNILVKWLSSPSCGGGLGQQLGGGVRARETWGQGGERKHITEMSGLCWTEHLSPLPPGRFRRLLDVKQMNCAGIKGCWGFSGKLQHCFHPSLAWRIPWGTEQPPSSLYPHTKFLQSNKPPLVCMPVTGV